MKDIGKNIKEIRVTKSMTQDELAEKLFVTRQTISNYENGRSRPDIDTVIKLAEVLEIDTNAILYGPPQSEAKSQNIRKLIFPIILLIVLGSIYIVLSVIFRDVSVRYELVLPKYLTNMTLRPVVMFLLGWVIFSVIGLFCNWQFLSSRWLKIVRYVLWTILGIMIVFPIPFIVYTVIGIIHTTLYTSTSLRTSYIPIYQEIAFFILSLTLKQPFVYSLLGGLLRIVTPQKPKRQQSNEK